MQHQTGSVLETLRKYRGAKAFFHDFAGNNGDELLRLGSRYLLEQAGVATTLDEGSADILVVRGNGAMNDTYPDLVNGVRQLLQRQLSKPAVVLPSSFEFSRSGALTALLQPRQAETTVFAREKYSYGALLKEPGLSRVVSIGLDHDPALSLPLPLPMQSTILGRHLLLVNRIDAEQPNSTRVLRVLRGAYVSSAPVALRRRLKPRLSASYSAHVGPSAHTARRWFNSMLPGAGLPTIVRDVSDSSLADFPEFVEVISASAAVATNRLHVGILAARLGLPTLLLPTRMRKLDGVYDFSLRQFDNVTLASPLP